MWKHRLFDELKTILTLGMDYRFAETITKTKQSTRLKQ
jgi:hypothetical protein